MTEKTTQGIYGRLLIARSNLSAPISNPAVAVFNALDELLDALISEYGSRAVAADRPTEPSLASPVRGWCCGTPITGPHLRGCSYEPTGPLDYDAPARVEELSHLARLTSAKVLYGLGQTNDAIFELLDALVAEETKRQAQAHSWLHAMHEPVDITVGPNETKVSWEVPRPLITDHEYYGLTDFPGCRYLLATDLEKNSRYCGALESDHAKTCDSVLMIAGADYRCEMKLSSNGRHDGWGHANQAAQAIWKTDYA